MHFGGILCLLVVIACLVQPSVAGSLPARRSSIRSDSLNPVDRQRNSIHRQSIMKNRGGLTINEAVQAEKATVATTNEGGSSVRKIVLRNALGLWGVVQVISILANAIKRLYPIAAQPFIQQDMLPYQWGLYVVWSIYMAYAEGYKAFQLKFSPMVVQRAFAIYDHPNISNCLLAGPYSMGLFGASRKRMIVSWCITAGVFSLVKVVKMLPYPYRSIVDAGVVVGLSWGTLSIVIFAIKALLGGKVEEPGENEEAPPLVPQTTTDKRD